MMTTTAMDLGAVAHWALGFLPTLEHEKRVVRIATTLFDLARPLLRAAALVHDVGRSIDKDDHPRVGARILLRDRSFRVRDDDRRALAYFTLYHRDRVPDLGRETLLRDDHDREAMRKILALL